MDELTEHLQTLNMIRSKFDQNKEINKTPIYQPGSLSKKQGPSKCNLCKQSHRLLNILFAFFQWFHRSPKK